MLAFIEPPQGKVIFEFPDGHRQVDGARVGRTAGVICGRRVEGGSIHGSLTGGNGVFRRKRAGSSKAAVAALLLPTTLIQ